MSTIITRSNETGLYSIGEKVIKPGSVLSEKEVEILEKTGKLYSPGWDGSSDVGLISGDLCVPSYWNQFEVLEYIGESSVCVDRSVFISYLGEMKAVLVALDDVMVFAPLNKESETVEIIIRHNKV